MNWFFFRVRIFSAFHFCWMGTQMFFGFRFIFSHSFSLFHSLIRSVKAIGIAFKSHAHIHQPSAYTNLSFKFVFAFLSIVNIGIFYCRIEYTTFDWTWNWLGAQQIIIYDQIVTFSPLSNRFFFWRLKFWLGLWLRSHMKTNRIIFIINWCFGWI